MSLGFNDCIEDDFIPEGDVKLPFLTLREGSIVKGGDPDNTGNPRRALRQETIYIYYIYRPVPVNPAKTEENLAASTAKFQLNSFKTVTVQAHVGGVKVSGRRR